MSLPLKKRYEHRQWMAKNARARKRQLSELPNWQPIPGDRGGRDANAAARLEARFRNGMAAHDTEHGRFP